jgi:uncharacterized protein (DUF983 family)
MIEHQILNSQTANAERDVKQSILRGIRQKCPACGEGKVFRAYLKVARCLPELW